VLCPLRRGPFCCESHDKKVNLGEVSHGEVSHDKKVNLGEVSP
jgi:hypothetical protein